MNLEGIIRGLIESKREDDYWDFKREPHDNNANLLHDILCLANSLHRGNKYLILGVTDPKEGATVIGLASNQTKRKTQVQYIDFLSSKVFAGDYRPEIELKSIIIDNKEVDVLIVFDRHLKPYYLSKDYSEQGKIVRANYIYTRVNDRNTPIDRSADIQIIEKMWQQRLGFDLPIVERMKLLLLQPDKWFKDIGNKNYSYHKEFPEFRIKFSRPNKFDQPEAYSFFFPNESSFLGEATFKYNSTTLFKLNYIYCDEMRITFAEPETQYLQMNNVGNWYHYYDLDTELGKFLYFLTEGLTQKSSRGSIFPFIIFENEEQRHQFNKYIVENKDLFDSIVPTFWGSDAKARMIEAKSLFMIDPIFIDKVIQMHQMWTTTFIN